MTKNVKTVKITIPSDVVLKRINSTPTLSRLSKLVLNVGENIEKVNHFQFAEQMRMFPIVGVKIIEICSNCKSELSTINIHINKCYECNTQLRVKKGPSVLDIISAHFTLKF